MMRPSALENWYSRQCNGEWEHSWGVKITTLDNPGWSVTIDLRDTRKQNSALDWVKIQRSEDDWIFYKVVDNRFEIKCGPKNLSEAVELFVDWFDSN
jgi:Immunity protein 53